MRFRSDDDRRPFGQDHPRARLTDDDVRLIRVLHADGMSFRVLAEKFEVSKRSIESVITGQTWRHVE
jgi:predicted DNA-binding protein YlxM (UPF0122 family)